MRRGSWRRRSSRLGERGRYRRAAAPHGVAQAEADAAEQHEAEEQGQQHAGAEGQLSVAALRVLFQIRFVKDSPHRPPSIP